MSFTRFQPPVYQFWPEYETTNGPAITEMCQGIGYAPDPEQELGLNIIFAKSEERNYLGNRIAACEEVDVIAGRQNLKTGLFKQAALGWLFVMDEKLIVWSAHEWSTIVADMRDLEELI